MTIAIYVFYFVILIGVLVFVHEGGHFLFAKLFGVKVHAFSFGFGPRLFGVKRGETDYRVSAVPIGGYVKMLGEDPNEETPPADLGRAFTDKPRWQRFCIIAGGPAMNLVFPLFLHFGVGLTISEVRAPEVGFVLRGLPGEAAGLEPGDRIVSIDGEKIETFEELTEIVGPSPGKPLEVGVLRDGKERAVTIVPSAVQRTIFGSKKKTVGQIGVYDSYPASVIGVDDPGSAAARAGLRTFDKITAVDGVAVEKYLELSRATARAAGGEISLSVLHLKRDAAAPFDDADYETKAVEIRLAVPKGAAGIAALGALEVGDFVADVQKGGAGAAIGLERGDRILSLDGVFEGVLRVEGGLADAPDICHVLAWSRGGVRMSAPYKLAFIPAGKKKDLGIAQDAYANGFSVHMPFVSARMETPSRLSHAVRYALAETKTGIETMGLGFELLFKREVSLESLGGPLMIGQLAGMAGQEGATSFIWMMALISLNLGFFNLLPIPILDGGQIAMIAAEAVTRRPISRKLRERIMLVGLALIGALMLFAIRNDIMRLIVG